MKPFIPGLILVGSLMISATLGRSTAPTTGNLLSRMSRMPTMSRMSTMSRRPTMSTMSRMPRMSTMPTDYDWSFVTKDRFMKGKSDTTTLSFKGFDRISWAERFGEPLSWVTVDLSFLSSSPLLVNSNPTEGNKRDGRDDYSNIYDDYNTEPTRRTNTQETNDQDTNDSESDPLCSIMSVFCDNGAASLDNYGLILSLAIACTLLA